MNDALNDEEETIEPIVGSGLNAGQSERMLREVPAGDTYEMVAARHGITRTGVERRIKALAARIAKNVGIEGLNEDGVVFVRRLRAHRQVCWTRLMPGGPAPVAEAMSARILTEEDIAAGARRLGARSPHALEDLALYCLLLATGARSLEIARLQVLDYLARDGAVRAASEFRAEVAITGRARPLYFRSNRLNAAIDEYLVAFELLRHLVDA